MYDTFLGFFMASWQYKRNKVTKYMTEIVSLEHGRLTEMTKYMTRTAS